MMTVRNSGILVIVAPSDGFKYDPISVQLGVLVPREGPNVGGF